MRPHICFDVLSLGALLLILVSGGCGQPKTSGPAAVAVSNHLAAIAAAGEPVTLDQLSRIYEEPPAAQNAAPLYAQAFAALKVKDANSPDFLARNQEALVKKLELLCAARSGPDDILETATIVSFAFVPSIGETVPDDFEAHALGWLGSVTLSP